MAVTNYDTVNGRLRGEVTSGVRTGYLTDALGSVTATVQSAAVVNTYRYKPYGAQLAKTGAGADPRYLWTGSSGSRSTGLSSAEQYNVSRHFNSSTGRWLAIDRLWPVHACAYCYPSPVLLVDPRGTSPCPPGDCCDRVPWPSAGGCMDWIPCPSPVDVWKKCAGYLSGKTFRCAELIDLVKSAAAACAGACPDGTGTGGGIPAAWTRCCENADGWKGCTKCCKERSVGEAAGAKACSTYCLLTHESAHQLECSRTKGNNGQPLPECCGHYAEFRCLMFITLSKCWPGEPADFGRIDDRNVQICMMKARAKGCPGA